MTVFLVEQNAFHALRLAHRGYVHGQRPDRAVGHGRELLANPRSPRRLSRRRRIDGAAMSDILGTDARPCSSA